MRELSVEQKAKAYDEALKWMCDLYPNLGIAAKEKAESIFPELSGSENERIRGAIIDHLKDNNLTEWATWLEKQSEQNPIFNADDWYVSKVDGKIHNIYHSVDKVELKFNVGDWIITNQNRVGIIVRILDEHYIVSFDGREVQISFEWEGKLFRKWSIKDARDGDVLCYKDEISLYKHDIKNCTKQETTFGGFVYHCCYDGKRFITDSLYSLTEQDKMDIHPATKEQRDLLFQKMHEAGYTFDFEKKELKKIEQPELTEFEESVKDMIDDYRDAIDAHAATTEEVKERAAYMLSLIPHKSAEWSEEDESNIKALESILYYDKKLPKDLYLRLNDWLKSLRPQNRWKVVDKGIYVKEPALAQKKDKSEPGQGFVVCYDHTLTPDVYERYIMLSDINCHSGWKPSDKQMEALLSEVNGWVKGCPKQIVLESLYDDLKKLKG